MTVKELKKTIETLPDDFEIVISAEIDPPVAWCEIPKYTKE